MMFIELLFWKNAATSEEVGRRYNWLVGSCNACGAVADAAGLPAVQHVASSQQLGCSSSALSLQQCRMAFVGFLTRAAFRLKRCIICSLWRGALLMSRACSSNGRCMLHTFCQHRVHPHAASIVSDYLPQSEPPPMVPFSATSSILPRTAL